MFIRLKIIAILGLFFCGATSASSSQEKINRVLYITLDGVRWQDVAHDHTHFPKFWKKYAKEATIYGKSLSKSTLQTASVPISLPSYQSQMAGSVQTCADNHCGRIHVETFPERILKRLNLPKEKVTTFSSWSGIAEAVEHIPGATYSSTGNKPVVAPDTLKADTVMNELNQKQDNHHPEGRDRYDQYTFAQAWHYFHKYEPRFMWIALNDADEAAHAGNEKAYHSALAYYDDMLDKVLSDLKARRIDKETLVIVTTDHGRGNGKNWINHAPEYPESRQIWAFVINGQLTTTAQDNQQGNYTLLSIRPTVEKALGKHLRRSV